MCSPIVTIIVPVFNSATTINRCVSSVKRQTIKNWELLLVDNGSSDNSYELISEFAKEDDRIRALRELKSGVSSARNTALNFARGQYICFVDSDDEVENDYLEYLLKDPKTDLTVCGYFVDTETTDGKKINSQMFISEKLQWDKKVTNSLLIPVFEKGFMHLCCNKLFRRDIIENNHIRFQYYPVNEDYIFTLTFLQYANSVSILDKALYHWIRVGGNATGVKSIPDNLLDIYNSSHLQCRAFFNDDKIADRIAYFSYEMIIYKYYEAIEKGRISKQEAYNKLDEFTHNYLVKDAYKSYKPTSKGERLLYGLMKMRLYKTHYFISQKILK
jgi:glycosyltransferase involved in cell wall biosynthesis